MSNQKQTQPKAKGGVNPFAAAVTGAIVGAGAVAAGVVALRSEKNRKKAKDYIKEVEGKLNRSKNEITKLSESTNDSKEEVKKIWQK